jgi:hypothetical protein
VGDADGVHLARYPIMNVRHEKGISLLLKIEIINVYRVCSQVSIELGLLGKGSLVNFFAPEGMLAEVFPVDTLHGILFE